MTPTGPTTSGVRRAAEVAQRLRDALHAMVSLSELVAEDPASTGELAAELHVQSVSATHLSHQLVESLEQQRVLVTSAPRDVLVVDDSPVNLLLTSSQVERLGHRAISVASGREALERISASPVDIVLMDWHMPDLDGVEATRRVRLREEATGTERVPIVALTARDRPGDRERCRAAGMNDFLAKPASFDDLHRVIEKWCPVEPAGVESGGGDLQLWVLDRLIADFGSSQAVRAVLAAFGEDLRLRSAEISSGASSQSWEDVRRAAYALSSPSRMLGAVRLADLSGELERCIGDGATPTADLVAELLRCADATSRGVRAFLESES